MSVVFGQDLSVAFWCSDFLGYMSLFDLKVLREKEIRKSCDFVCYFTRAHSNTYSCSENLGGKGTTEELGNNGSGEKHGTS